MPVKDTPEKEYPAKDIPVKDITLKEYPDSYYAATRNQHSSYPELEQSLDAEVCIIGGGYAGLMTALGLIERGVNNVVLLEKNRVGWGASGRNGGFVFGGYSLGPQRLIKQVGLEQARALYQFTQSAVNLIRQRIDKYQINCDRVDDGVILANWFKQQDDLHQLQDFMASKMSVDWQYLSPEKLSEKIHSERYCGGLFEPNAMHFHPLNYALGIAEQIVSAGGKIFEQTGVINVDDKAAIKKVITEQGVINCKHVVMTGGGYVDKAMPALKRSVLPIATYVMATEPLGEKLNDCLSTRAAIYDTRFAFDYYRPLKDTRLLWGGRISARTLEPSNLKQALHKDMVKVFPSLASAKVDYVWQGYMGYARHEMAQVGQLSSNVWFCNGFGGHGVAPTTAAGEIIASAIASSDTTYQQFESWRLPWNGGPFGPAAAQLSYWWYQLKDWYKDKLD